MKNQQIISVKQARRLLGKQAESLDDIQVIEMVENLTEIAKAHLKKKGVKKSNNSLGL